MWGGFGELPHMDNIISFCFAGYQTMPFGIGKFVDVIGTEEEGFLGCFHQAQIKELRPFHHVVVQYTQLLERLNSRRMIHLRETVHIGRLRPSQIMTFQGHDVDVGDHIDCYLQQGYWHGVVTEVISRRSKYRVLFLLTEDTAIVDHYICRPHYDWDGAEFIPSTPHKWVMGY